MKTNQNPLLSAAAVAAVSIGLLLSACSRSDDATTTASTTDSATGATSTAAVTAPDSWDSLKTASYDQRSEVATKVNNYAQQLDQRIENATGEASTRLAEARDELRTAASEVSNATAETWEATKERIGRAWQKAESATMSVAE